MPELTVTTQKREEKTQGSQKCILNVDENHLFSPSATDQRDGGGKQTRDAKAGEMRKKGEY